MQYTPFVSYVSHEIIGETARNGRSRLPLSPYFKDVQNRIERLARNSATTVSLNQRTAETRMQESKAEEVSTNANRAEPGGTDMFPRNPYNTEVLHITTDYLHALKVL